MPILTSMEVDSMEHPVRLLINIGLALAIYLGGCSSTPRQSISRMVNSDSIAIYTQTGITYVNDTPFSGKVITYYLNTKDTAEIRMYKNGKEDGRWTQYYPNQHLKAVRFFSNGNKTGNYSAWWPNGVKQLNYTFRNNEYEGTCTEWDAQGQKIKEMNYQQGHEEGAQQAWYADGNIKFNYVAASGRRYGLMGTKNCKNVSDHIFKK